MLWSVCYVIRFPLLAFLVFPLELKHFASLSFHNYVIGYFFVSTHFHTFYMWFMSWYNHFSYAVLDAVLIPCTIHIVVICWCKFCYDFLSVSPWLRCCTFRDKETIWSRNPASNDHPKPCTADCLLHSHWDTWI